MADVPPAGRPDAAGGAGRWPCLVARGEAACSLDLAVVPQARRMGADGLHDGALRVRLNAPPLDGRANDALIGWLSDQLALPRRAVQLVRGQAARRKRVHIDAPAPAVRRWLDSL